MEPQANIIGDQCAGNIAAQTATGSNTFEMKSLSIEQASQNSY